MEHEKVLTMTLGSHFLSLKRIAVAVRPIIVEFARRYVKYGIQVVKRNEAQREALAVYGAATKDRSEFRFHINLLEELKTWLKLNYITDNLIETIYKPTYSPPTVTFKVKEQWTLRDYQYPVVDYLVKDEGPISRFVGIQTGFGKTLSALFAISKIGLKPAIIVKPMYIYKWVEDVQKYYDISVEKIMVVQGLVSLQALIELASLGQLKDIEVFVISNKTYQLYIKQYEMFKSDILDQGYGCVPEDFFQKIGAGIRLIDEVHQDFHLNFKIDLYTNVFRSISLSATLLSKDPFMERVYEIAYPKYLRYAEVALEKYINSFAVLYRTRLNIELKSSERGSSNYSHNAFEESIIKHKDKNILKNYLNLISHCVQSGYYYDYKKGQKLIIFCYRTDFCQMVVEHLRQIYPSLDIRRFTADDPDENMYEPDIRVTTLGSGSTAHDIDNLKTAILTVAVDSVQSNIQALGRLRKLKDLTPRFYYFACADISKHMQYHYAKEILFKQRALTFKVLNAPNSI